MASKREPTQSEKLAFANSSLIFSSLFSYLSPRFDKGKGGNELCDCILEFQNTYIVIQIKERTNSSMNQITWFEKNVGEKAVDQINNTITIIKNVDKHHFYINDDGNNTLTIDRTKAIIPIVVFDNNTYSDYPRVLYSKVHGCLINVFSTNDFIGGFNNLLIPNEIIKYLTFRTSLLKKGNDVFNARMLTFENKNYSILIGGGIKDEADFADIFYQYNYYETGVTKEQIIRYNTIINYLDESLPDNNPIKKRLIALFLSVDIKLAINVSHKWYGSIDRCSLPDVYPPFSLHLDDLEVLLVSKSTKISDEEFINYYTNLTMCYSYKDHVEDVVSIAFSKREDGEIEITFFGDHYSFQYPDKEVEERFKEFLDNYTKPL